MELYTCKGKGGRYRLITELNEDGSARMAVGAGTCRDSPDLIIYRDVMNHAIYFRTYDDFMHRMRVVHECPDCEERQAMLDFDEAMTK